MIDYAYKYKKELENIWPSLISDDYFEFYLETQVRQYVPDIQLYPDNKLKTQMVSIFNDVENDQRMLNGFMEAELDWVNRKVVNLSYVSFAEKGSYVFGKDVIRFINKIFYTDNFRKIQLNTVEGNPHSDFTVKLINNYGGRHIGVAKDEVMLRGEYRDMRLYEILKSEWKGQNIDDQD